MKFRTNSTPQASIQMAPMIDIVFLLLVFFIVTWSYARFETELDIAVPAAEEGAEPKRTVGEIIVNLKEDGSIFINAVELSEDELLARLVRIAEVHRDQAVILRGDMATSYDDVIKVLDICKKAGIWNVAFATSRPDAPPPPQ